MTLHPSFVNKIAIILPTEPVPKTAQFLSLKLSRLLADIAFCTFATTVAAVGDALNYISFLLE